MVSLVGLYKQGRDVPELWDEVKAISYDMARRYGQNYNDSQDISQETCLRFFQKIDRYNEDKYANHAPYIRQMTVNIIKDNFRGKRANFDEFDLLDDIKVKKVESPLDLLIKKESEAGVKQSVTNLESPLREATSDYYLEELNYKEISKRRNVPIGTVKSRLYKARSNLKEDLLRILH